MSPGGAGLVSEILSKGAKENIFLIDREAVKIRFAAKHTDANRVIYSLDRIYDVVFLPKTKWLLVNSLYLLNDVDKLFARQKTNLGFM